MVKYGEDQIVDLILDSYQGEKIAVLAPVIKGRKGHYRELFQQISKQGFVRVRVDGEIMEITSGMRLDRYKIHDIEVVIDRMVATEKDKQRLRQSVNTAMDMGKGSLMVMNWDSEETRHFSRNLMCPSTGISYPDPEPNLFSFNSPYRPFREAKKVKKYLQD